MAASLDELKIDRTPTQRPVAARVGWPLLAAAGADAGLAGWSWWRDAAAH